jgi:hypothetical protein
MHYQTATGAAFFAVFLLSTVTGSGQGPTVPRTPWGHPDLQGSWTNSTLTPLERPTELGAKEFFTPAEAAEYQKTALKKFLAANNLTEEAAISGEFEEGVWVEERSLVATRRTSLIIGPTGRVPPLTPAAQKAAAARGPRQIDFADNPEDRMVGERCLWFQVGGPPMLPGVGYNSNYEIVQTPTHLVILAEMGFSVRIIPLDGRPHLPATLRDWQGDSVGRWEGDTLVVETTNFNDKVIFRGSSRARLRLVERFTRVNAGQIMYRLTVEDPDTWTAPWTAEVPMRPLDGRLYEYACHEGNIGLENILRGARYTEKAAPKP